MIALSAVPRRCSITNRQKYSTTTHLCLLIINNDLPYVEVIFVSYRHWNYQLNLCIFVHVTDNLIISRMLRTKVCYLTRLALIQHTICYDISISLRKDLWDLFKSPTTQMPIDCPRGVAFRPLTTDRDLHTAGYHPSVYINEPDSCVYFAIGSVLLRGRKECKHIFTRVSCNTLHRIALNNTIQYAVHVVLR